MTSLGMCPVRRSICGTDFQVPSSALLASTLTVDFSFFQFVFFFFFLVSAFTLTVLFLIELAFLLKCFSFPFDASVTLIPQRVFDGFQLPSVYSPVFTESCW